MRDPWDWAIDIIMDPMLGPHLVWDAQIQQTWNGNEWERFFTEPWTAKQFWDAQVWSSPFRIYNIMIDCLYHSPLYQMMKMQKSCHSFSTLTRQSCPALAQQRDIPLLHDWQIFHIIFAIRMGEVVVVLLDGFLLYDYSILYKPILIL